MARNSKIRISEKPWLHGASAWWCATVGGKRRKLDRDYKAACRKLKALQVQAKKGLVDNREWWDAPFSELADKYLDIIQVQKKPATYHNFRFAILRALTILGPTIRVNQLTAGHLEEIEIALKKGGEGSKESGVGLKKGRSGLKKGGYSPTTIKNTIATVQGVLNWAVRTGRIDSSPVPKYTKPAALIRNRVMTRTEFGSLLRHSDRNFRRFLIALRLTGCRPGELSGLIWDWVDLDEGMWIIPDHKTITRQREPMPRMIPLPATVLRMCRWLARKPHAGSDYVFLNKLGFPYSKDCLVKKMARLRERANLGIKGGEKVVLYNLRIAFGTESVGKVSDIELAALMGHTEVRMTQRYYKASVARLRDIRCRLEAHPGVRENVSASGNGHSADAAAGVLKTDGLPANSSTPVPQEALTQAVS